ncbi:MAG: hypothetical protein IVW36_01490 [Dehalococcoidia bacterium]|nr:hypothetical protein [Dehalococcoidia bacterium]
MSVEVPATRRTAAGAPSVATRARLLWPAAAIAATFALTFALRFPSFFEPRWYGDEGIFASIAASLRDGRMLYSGVWDNKPPLIFFTYAAIQAVAGVGERPLHIAATMSVLATQAALVAAAALLFGERARPAFGRAAVAGVVFALLMGSPLLEGNLALTETFMILPASLAALVFILGERHREAGASPRVLVVVGALIGIAAAYKQVAIFDGLAIAVMVRFRHERALRDLGALAAGFAVPQAALALLFLATGAFGAYWYAIVGSLGMYARLAPSIGVLRRVEELLPPLLVLGWLTYRHQRVGRLGLGWYSLAWLAFAFAGATSSTFGFPHYLQQTAPALALAAAGLPAPRVAAQELRAVAVVAVAAVFVVITVQAQFGHAFYARKQLSPHWYYAAFVHRQSGEESVSSYESHFDGSVPSLRALQTTIASDGAGDSAFYWSEAAWIYAQAGLRNPTRYYTSVLGTRVPGARAEIMRDLAARPPAYVAISRQAYRPFPQLESFVTQRYTLIAVRGNDWRLYRRAGARGTLPPGTVVR